MRRMIAPLFLLSLAMTSCASPEIAFSSNRKLDGTDEVAYAYNIWRVFDDGTGLVALTDGTVQGSYSVQPAWSPDGTTIAYGSTRKLDGSDGVNPCANIWKVSPGKPFNPTPITKAMTKGADSNSAAWSHDGTRLAFESSRNVDLTDSALPLVNVWVVNADGTGLQPLTKATAEGASAHGPQWSLDGAKVAFYSRRLTDGTDATGAASNIWMVNADGTGLKPVTTATAQGTDSSDPQWSPDGKKIVFESLRRLDGGNFAGSVYNIWVVNADGTGLQPLTNTTAKQTHSRSPQWSPDGKKIVFESSRKLDGSDAAGPTANVWVMNADGTSLTPLTKLTAAEELSMAPQWFGGGRIVFQSRRAIDGSDAINTHVTFNIWVVNADGTGLKPLTASVGSNGTIFNTGPVAYSP